MKKLNNRGFAISTVLYSLLIMLFLIVTLMLGIMASSRNNSKALVSEIEDELNRYSLTTTEFIPSNKNGVALAQEYIVPSGKSGWYKIELWGAAGGATSLEGGAGAYTSGIIYLEENTSLYFYIGDEGSSTNGGANGGGNGNGTGRGGGGATDVRTINGDWNAAGSLSSRIMVAGGGGGASQSTTGQNGVTLETRSGLNQGIGQNGTTNGGGGGGGYYGGQGGSTVSGAGGSSYISGYAGVSPSSNGKIFYDGMMSENANTGKGKAKIQLLSSENVEGPPPKKTNKLNGVRYIQDCLTGIGESGSTQRQWIEIQAMYGGNNVAFEKTNNSITDSKFNTTPVTSANECVIVDLGAMYDLDEIAVWHISEDTSQESTPDSAKILYNHRISVAGNNKVYRNIRSPKTDAIQTSPENITGIHISAWDIDSDAVLPNGTYYIFSALSPNTSLITALNSIANETGAFERRISLAPINGSDLQKWVFTKIDNQYYKIVEKESQQAMQVIDAEAYPGTKINTSSAYNDNYDWAKWKVEPLGDGTYRISPKIATWNTTLATYERNFNTKTGSIILEKTESTSNLYQRFYLVSAD